MSDFKDREIERLKRELLQLQGLLLQDRRHFIEQMDELNAKLKEKENERDT